MIIKQWGSHVITEEHSEGQTGVLRHLACVRVTSVAVVSVLFFR